MSNFRVRAARLLFLGVLSVPCASPAGTAAADGDDTAMMQQMSRDLAATFGMPDELRLDPALRAEAEAIAAAHLARMREVLPVWIQEERQLQAGGGSAATSTAVYFAVTARVLNAMALWQIEAGDAAYEKATLDAIQASPSVCAVARDGNPRDFSWRILRVQAMPAQARPAALATERRLLEGWGKPHPAPPPWPAPLPQEAAMEAVEQMRAGGARPALAMTPSLASAVLAKRERYDELPWQTRCAFQRWWLGASLAQGRPPADVLTAFRYGTLAGAVDRYGNTFEDRGAADGKKSDPAAPPGYPKLAARFDVTGSTLVERRYDSAGRPLHARVIQRNITVRGIRDTRPVAFENTFDALAVRYALAGGAGARPAPGAVERFQMVWKLESTNAAAPQGAKP